MNLIDDITITVKAGDGGNGATATKQLFGSKKKIPDGGNGGKGGDVYVLGDNNVFDLSEFSHKKKVTASNGVNGLNKDLDGRNGEDIFIKVPFGTVVTDTETKQFVEILNDSPFCVAYGGEGGMGNHDYNPSMKNFSPRKSAGTLGEERILHLVLNLIADIGLVGFPNAGKSSLLKSLTSANPKIGDYPFTTLEPNLGALGKTIIADIPGLIEGASNGKGLGIKFLKHIKKTKILFHCINSTSQNVLDDYKTAREEFANFDNSLLIKDEIIVLTKIDLVDSAELAKKIKKLKSLKKEIIACSVYEEKSINSLRKIVQTKFN